MNVSARAALVGAALLSIVTITACARGAATAEISGAALYSSCVSCHGPDGRGDAAFRAPNIAGLPEWYLSSQVKRFQSGLRGKHPDDVEGLKMRAMARQMLSDAEVDAVAAYIAGLPKAVNAATLTSTTPAAAEPLFAVCSACHGPKGEGNQALNAPPIAGLDDWYIALQLQKFRTSVRGTAPGDVIGPQMMGMAMTVPPDQIENLAAYVHALKP